MMTLMLDTPAMIRDLDHVRLREWLQHLPPRCRTPHLDTLRRKLGEADVVERIDVPRDLVTMNSLVGLRDLTADEKYTVILVYPDEANTLQHKVSVAVPLGTEMLGRQVGMTLHCPVSTGIRPIRIERVYYQPEAAGDHHR